MRAQAVVLSFWSVRSCPVSHLTSGTHVESLFPPTTPSSESFTAFLIVSTVLCSQSFLLSTLNSTMMGSFVLHEGTSEFLNPTPIYGSRYHYTVGFLNASGSLGSSKLIFQMLDGPPSPTPRYQDYSRINLCPRKAKGACLNQFSFPFPFGNSCTFQFSGYQRGT